MSGANTGRGRNFRMLLIASLGCHLLAAPPALYLLGRPNAPEPGGRLEGTLELTPAEIQPRPEEEQTPVVDSAGHAPRQSAHRWADTDLVPPEEPEIPAHPALDWHPGRDWVPLDAWRVPVEEESPGPAAVTMTPPPPEAAEPAESAGPRYSDSPPPSLSSGLGRGYLTAIPGGTVLSDAAREKLRAQVYARHSYPREAVELELEGDVVLRFRLDAEGAPTDIEAVETPKELAVLEKQAVRMVREGGPYPRPTTRRKVEFLVAVAYLHDDMEGAVRSAVVRPSGWEAVDRFATRIARADAISDPEPGWKVVEFKVSATMERSGSESGAAGVRVTKLEGDERWREFLETNSSRFGAAPEKSDYFSIPIRFRFSD